MNAFSHVILALTIITGISAPLHSEEPRLPDTARISKLLWEIPEYQPYLVPGTDMEATDDQIMSNASGIFITRDLILYGDFYKETGDIDTVEEYCLGVFFSGKKPVTPKLQKAFDEEFPHNAEGCHRMAALWYKIYSISPNYNENAINGVPFVIKQGRKNGIVISEESAKQYYEKAVRNSLNNAFNTELSKAGLKPDAVSLEKIIRPWYAYFTTPTPENYSVISIGHNCVRDISVKKKSMTGLIKAYDNAVLQFAGESFYTQWTYVSDRSYFYEEDIEKICKEYFADIPIFNK